MSATDELRRMLDERGVECVTDDGEYVKSTTWYGVSDKRATFVEYANGECRFAMDDYQLTPEQAIAATLGRERETELQKALNKAAGNWAKADAELCKALDFMRIWISEDAHLGESELSAVFEKAEGLRNLDAIESAITATLGAGTCHTVEDGGLMHCSECGGGAEKQSWAYWNYCPNCGRKVEG